MEMNSGNGINGGMAQLTYINERLQCTEAEKAEAFQTVKKLFRYARIARKDGILGLEEPLKKEKDKFLKDGLTFAMDAVEPEEVLDYLLSYITVADMRGRRFLEMMMISDTVLKIQENANPKRIILRFVNWFGEEYQEQFDALIEEMNSEEQRLAERMAAEVYDRSPITLSS